MNYVVRHSFSGNKSECVLNIFWKLCVEQAQRFGYLVAESVSLYHSAISVSGISR